MNRNSNLAYERSERAVSYPMQVPYTSSPNVRIKVTKKAAETKKKSAETAGIAKVLLVMCCAFIVLFRGVMITDRTSNVEKKQAELEALITSNEKLQFEIDRSLDLDHVEKVAKDELGMRRAEKYQTIYLNLEQTDFVEKTAKDLSLSAKISRLFGSTKAYAYLD